VFCDKLTNDSTFQEIKQSASELKQSLTVLNCHLLENMYLVGDRITQADISCSAALLPAYQLVNYVVMAITKCHLGLYR